MARYYNTQPGKNPDSLHMIIVAPTGMVAYHKEAIQYIVLYAEISISQI